MSYFLDFSIFYAILFIIPGATKPGQNILNFDKQAFYVAMRGHDLAEIDSILAGIREGSIPEKTAYEGALLMKKAGLLTKAKEKLNLFKSGRKKLEEAIKNDMENAEYRFLRLIIQENAPKIVKYKSDLKNDHGDFVRTSFKELDPVVQQAVKDYSKRSTFLKPADF